MQDRWYQRFTTVRYLTIAFSAIYFPLLIYIVFFARRRRHLSERLTNLTPLRRTISAYRDLNGDPVIEYKYFENLLGNIVLFIPLSVIFIILFRVKSKIMAVMMATLVSITIETLQYIFKVGVADSDDVILNTIGASIGVLLFAAYERLQNRRAY